MFFLDLIRLRVLRRLLTSIAAATLLVCTAAPAMDLGEVARSMRNASEITRHGKSIYDRVQSITRASSQKRNDSLTSDGNRVVFYSASWCGYCDKARDYMRSNDVDYVEYDIEKSSKGRADYETLNARGVPILLIGDQRMSGWSESQFRRQYSKLRSSKSDAPAVVTQAPSSGVPDAAIESGAVLAAKIDNIAVFASSSRDAEVVTRLKKGEEVVATAQSRDEWVAVESASGSGWVDARLFRVSGE